MSTNLDFGKPFNGYLAKIDITFMVIVWAVFDYVVFAYERSVLKTFGWVDLNPDARERLYYEGTTDLSIMNAILRPVGSTFITPNILLNNVIEGTFAHGGSSKITKIAPRETPRLLEY